MLKFGNHKLGDDTAIFNMGTALECPARRLGMCEVVNAGYRCYAEKAEIQYPGTVPAARRRQEDYWKDTTKDRILQDFAKKITRRRKSTRYLRFNESGDFFSQVDIDKLSYIASGLQTLDVTTYGYTARRDLDYSRATFLVKGSGGDFGNNGRTTVIQKDGAVPEGYLVCPGSCKRCNICKISVPHKVAFRQH